MYLRSLVVFTLCTAFVLAFVAVLNYEAGVVGNQTGGVSGTLTTSCKTSDVSCESFSITTAKLTVENYSGTLLGPGSYTTLVLGVNTSGGFAIDSLSLFIDNASAGTLPGPFVPGENRILNVTLPATIAVTPGRSYVLSVEGIYGGSGSVWESVKVVAE